MTNWHYYTETKEKIGPITGKELKQLVQQGVITPETFIEDPHGRTGLAKHVNGLTFPSATSNTFLVQPVSEKPSSIVIPVPPVQPAHAQVLPPAQQQKTYCTNCGNSVSEQAVACMSCGAKPVGHKKFCRQCAAALNPEQVVCVKCNSAVEGGLKNFAQQIFGSFGNATSSPSVKTTLFSARTVVQTMWKKNPATVIIATVAIIAFFCIFVPIPVLCGACSGSGHIDLDTRDARARHWEVAAALGRTRCRPCNGNGFIWGTIWNRVGN